MLVKMLVGLSGPFYTLDPGDEFHFPDDEARRLLDAGFAVPVVEQPIERAVKAPAPERRGKRGRDVVPTEGDNAGE
jgi:hypothetical protein